MAVPNPGACAGWWVVGAGPARERQAVLAGGMPGRYPKPSIKTSGILPAGFAGLSRAGPAPTRPSSGSEIREGVGFGRVLEEAVDVFGVDLVDVAVAEAGFAVLVDEQGADAFAEVGV